MMVLYSGKFAQMIINRFSSKMTSLSLFFDRLEECFSGKTLISPDFEYFMIRAHLCPLIFELFTDDICWIIGFFVIKAFLRTLHRLYFFF